MDPILLKGISIILTTIGAIPLLWWLGMTFGKWIIVKFWPNKIVFITIEVDGQESIKMVHLDIPEELSFALKHAKEKHL